MKECGRVERAREREKAHLGLLLELADLLARLGLGLLEGLLVLELLTTLGQVELVRVDAARERLEHARRLLLVGADLVGRGLDRAAAGGEQERQRRDARGRRRRGEEVDAQLLAELTELLLNLLGRRGRARDGQLGLELADVARDVLALAVQAADVGRRLLERLDVAQAVLELVEVRGRLLGHLARRRELLVLLRRRRLGRRDLLLGEAVEGALGGEERLGVGELLLPGAQVLLERAHLLRALLLAALDLWAGAESAESALSRARGQREREKEDARSVRGRAARRARRRGRSRCRCGSSAP